MTDTDYRHYASSVDRVLPPYSCLWSEGTPPHSVVGSASLAQPTLRDRIDVDVCIVGGGFTGLWTAWHLKQLDPSIRIAVLEKNHVGFGASGRNGGWVQTALPSSIPEIASAHSATEAMAVHRAMVETVEAVGSFARRHAPTAYFAHAGQLQVARTQSQLTRLRRWVDDHHRIGMTADDYRWMSAEEVSAKVDVSSVLGGYYTPHCAVVNPVPLVAALAARCGSLGVEIFESTAVTNMEPNLATTSSGSVRSTFVVRATEGYTAGLAGHRRDLIPVFSLMIATEPLDEATWDEIGWRDRFTLSDGRLGVIYAQRTADGRIAFGGRGAPYRFGSASDDTYSDCPVAHSKLKSVLIDLFPVLADTGITHRWGGVLGVPRDWQASVGLDRTTGLAWGGGYVGDGLAATHLAGRTLADLMLGVDSPITTLPWVDHRSKRWEPEPFRFIGVRAVSRLASSVDEAEKDGKSARIRSRAFDAFM